MRRVALLIVGLLLAAACSCESALAEGGASIAAAPAVIYGQQQFGNLTTGSGGACFLPDDKVYRSWWAMHVTAGDSIKLDWEAQSSDVSLNLFSFGTTDFTFPAATPVMRSFLNNNLKAELLYQAAQTGTMPVEFFANECNSQTIPGPYDFVAYVQHAVRLSLPQISVVRRRGMVRVAAHSPDGGTINDPGLLVAVQIKATKSWKSVGSASVANSVATINLNIPRRFRHKRISVRATAHGYLYKRTSTSRVRAKVR